jgi:hypothetical protein
VQGSKDSTGSYGGRRVMRTTHQDSSGWRRGSAVRGKREKASIMLRHLGRLPRTADCSRSFPLCSTQAYRAYPPATTTRGVLYCIDSNTVVHGQRTDQISAMFHRSSIRLITNFFSPEPHRSAVSSSRTSSPSQRLA